MSSLHPNKTNIQNQVDEQVARMTGLFERYTALQRTRDAAFMTRFQAFVPGFQAALRSADEIHRASAPGFNIFTFLKVAESELMHSDFLAFLLNPRKEHAQGNAFLKAFFQMLTEKNIRSEKSSIPPLPLPPDPFEKGYWQVDREAFFTSQDQEYNYLDIVLSNPVIGARYIIENKVNADEQPNQISRYYNHLEQGKDSAPYRGVLFLTRSGYAAGTANGATYYRLSYRDDIHRWLDIALEEVKAPTVRETVKQYIALVHEF